MDYSFDLVALHPPRISSISDIKRMSLPYVFWKAPASATPLGLIGGSHTPKQPESPKISPYSVLDSVFFDWYQCSVSVDAETVVDALVDHYGASVRPAKPQPPYLKALELIPLEVPGCSKDVVPFCSVHFGGYNERTLLRASSDNAHEFSDLVREKWPDHRVSRLDVALDFQEGPDFFNDMAEWLIEYAKNPPASARCSALKIGYLGDWANGVHGRTLTIGSRQSAVYIRLYEKGLEQVAKGNHLAPIDWVRFEAEIKPQNKVAKINASIIPARQFFGASPLLRDFAAMLGDSYEPLKMGTVKNAVDHERTFSHLCYQYGAVFEQLLEDCQGDAGAFVDKIMQTVEYEKQKRKGIRSRIKAYSGRDMRRSGLTASGVSVPASDYPRPEKSALTPALILEYPKILLGLDYRKIPDIHGLRLLAPR